ncbi:Uncharacterized protein TCM_001654 [Theobroma cacao]|uniref:Uncharacterized protein n=1 Tax=Theobroma cacao TaxID=3641 RepID=A0A061DJD4_THECC|nr:Uncharacterized protein TCM_001654 [Theobroma cacao]
MKPFAFLRRASATAVVAPSPVTTPFGQQLQPLLHCLLSQPVSASESAFLCATWFLHALHASTTTQTIALDSLKPIDFRHSDRAIVETYLEDNVTVLDACNQLSEKMQVIQEYAKSLRVVSHLLQGPTPTTLARALGLLESSWEAMERRFREIPDNKYNSRSSSSKMSRKKVAKQQDNSEYGEILNGSMAMALMACVVLGTALSFKSKRLPTNEYCSQSSIPTSWSLSLHELHKQLKGRKLAGNNSSMMLCELRQAVKVAQDLQHHIKIRNKSGVEVAGEELKKRCNGLEEQITALDEGVRELYKRLVSVRMALLGFLSRA